MKRTWIGLALIASLVGWAGAASLKAPSVARAAAACHGACASCSGACEACDSPCATATSAQGLYSLAATKAKPKPKPKPKPGDEPGCEGGVCKLPKAAATLTAGAMALGCPAKGDKPADKPAKDKPGCEGGVCKLPKAATQTPVVKLHQL